ncbi:MAG: hypothetical protein ABSG42_06875 [Nitrospirota bacterium]
MTEWMVSPLLTALGFLMGFFYTRTMKMSYAIPEKYMNKTDCLQLRSDCLHMRDLAREEVLQRLDRLETKMDRLSERLLK